MKLVATKEVRFKTKDGKVETSKVGESYEFEDERCEALIKLGYFEKTEKTEKTEEISNDFNKMNKTKLLEYAKQNDIDVNEEMTRKEILGILENGNS